jgi:hypothetical protein
MYYFEHKEEGKSDARELADSSNVELTNDFTEIFKGSFEEKVEEEKSESHSTESVENFIDEERYHSSNTYNKEINAAIVKSEDDHERQWVENVVISSTNVIKECQKIILETDTSEFFEPNIWENLNTCEKELLEWCQKDKQKVINDCNEDYTENELTEEEKILLDLANKDETNLTSSKNDTSDSNLNEDNSRRFKFFPGSNEEIKMLEYPKIEMLEYSGNNQTFSSALIEYTQAYKMLIYKHMKPSMREKLLSFIEKRLCSLLLEARRDDDVKSWAVQNRKILDQYFDTIKNIRAGWGFPRTNDDLIYLEYLISNLKGNFDKEDSVANEKALHL